MILTMSNYLKIILVIISVCVKNTHLQSPFNCGMQKKYVNELIIRGNDTLPGEWPWHTAIYHRNETNIRYVCGGTLISEVFVLTAAHCIVDEYKNQLSKSLVFVRLGVHNLEAPINSQKIQQSDVEHIYQPNKTKNETRNDIAILKLATEVQFNDYIQPACVSSTKDLTGELGIVIGWGLTEDDKYSTTLKSAQMPVIDSIQCLKSNRPLFGNLLDEGIFCAGNTTGSTVCNGDSGGGIFFSKDKSWYLGGIVSFSAFRGRIDKRCVSNGYAGFTKIYSHLSWISSITKQQFLIDSNSSILCNPKDAQTNRNHTNLFPRNCGVNTINRIIKGQIAELFEFPWMAMLLHRNFKNEIEFTCAGTLINERYVLTAAHCVVTKPEKVILGEHTTEQDPDCQELDNERECAPPIREYGIECITIHQDYDWRKKETDIALIRLLEVVHFSDHIQPVCLPVTMKLRNLRLSKYIVTGWGRTSIFENDHSKTLLKATVKAIHRSVCQDLEANSNLEDNKLCMDGTPNGDTCSGDSGGPLGYIAKFRGMRFIQFGVTSYGPPRCDVRISPAVYTKVSSYMDWIMANMYP